jgi:hypothetical protein
MTTLAVKQGRPHEGKDTYRIVVRRHDLSGTDYEPMLAVDRTVASALGSGGVVVRLRDTVHAPGRPGIVIDAVNLPDGLLCELRADVADPTTVIDTFVGDRRLAGEIMGDDAVVAMHWVGVPPAD